MEYIERMYCFSMGQRQHSSEKFKNYTKISETAALWKVMGYQMTGMDGELAAYLVDGGLNVGLK